MHVYPEPQLLPYPYKSKVVEALGVVASTFNLSTRQAGDLWV